MPAWSGISWEKEEINSKSNPPKLHSLLDAKYHFRTLFDSSNGNYARSGILDKEGNDTGIDPFMASFPHLLDVGIMGHCQHGLSGKCAQAGIQCYQSGGSRDRPNMTFTDFITIADQCAGKVHQFALGGRGDPDMHENFEEILAYSRNKDIVPNMTTSGYGLTQESAKIIARYCGAAAVSWYRNDYTYRAIEMLVAAGAVVNVHYVLSNDSIDEAIAILQSGKLPAGVSRMIFLLFKPVGQGDYANVLSAGDYRIETLFSLIDAPEVTHIVGYDSCCVPALVNYSQEIDPHSYDTCEGARFSAYISADMWMTPCSFDQQGKYAVNLRNMTISRAWESMEFENFRDQLRNACPECGHKDTCFGGCPITPEIVLCQNRQAILSGGIS
ncbi:MAG: radical SAM protein [Dehalococcoidales bacterium]